MKIQINISSDTLIALHKILQKIYELPISVDKRENVYKSIGIDLASLFEKKYNKHIKKSYLFESNKKINTNLKYHEAWGLEEILKDLIHLTDTPYQKLQIQKVINSLDQKLA